MMRRREFITLLGGVAAGWPFAVRAQHPVMPTVGIMLAGSLEALRRAIAGIHTGLKESGFVEGQNVLIEYRFAEGHFDRFAAFASELVHRQVTVLMVSSANGVQAAKQATTTIPIVFSIGGDPVESGLVASINRPESNITGVYQFTAGLEAKRLGLLHEMVPKAMRIAVLINPNYSESEAQSRDVQQAALSLGVQLVIARANAQNDFDAAFTTFSREGTGALLICASPFFNSRREQLVVLAARHMLPAMYEWRDFAAAGGLMSYGTSLPEAYRQAGAYAGRILKGARPADLPIVQSTKFEFVINLSTAKALGIDAPPGLSARADEIIE
jgi:putative tryptophan/tyrosine transport system substrate-binding protein